MNFIHLPSVGSTNSEMLERLSGKTTLEEGTVIWTMRQTAGRGQTGNGWESEPDKNISFSLLLHPTFLAPSAQFILSEIVSLAVAETLEEYVAGFEIKWPNDIYHDDRKIAGILIENRIVGSQLQDCVVGIGININQMEFLSDAPNPVSLRQLMLETVLEREGGFPNTLIPPVATDTVRSIDLDLLAKVEAEMDEISPEIVLHKVCDRIMSLYGDIQGSMIRIHQAYTARLYRGEGFYPYADAETGQRFDAQITDIAADGRMTLETQEGEKRQYWFKEVKFALPCGVTKE